MTCSAFFVAPYHELRMMAPAVRHTIPHKAAPTMTRREVFLRGARGWSVSFKAADDNREQAWSGLGPGHEKRRDELYSKVFLPAVTMIATITPAAAAAPRLASPIVFQVERWSTSYFAMPSTARRVSRSEATS